MLIDLVFRARFEIAEVMANLPVALLVADDDAIETHGYDGAQQCQVIVR